jgi:Spy/CpxP family protein refolding chaperone
MKTLFYFRLALLAAALLVLTTSHVPADDNVVLPSSEEFEEIYREDIPPAKRAELKETIGTIMLVQLRRELDLSREKAFSLYEMVEAHHESMRQLHQETRRVMGRLKTECAAPSPNARSIGELSEQLIKLRQTRHQKEMAFLTKIDQVLDPVEKGKFLLFQAAFKRRMGKILMDYKDCRGGPDGPGGPGRLRRP